MLKYLDNKYLDNKHKIKSQNRHNNVTVQLCVFTTWTLMFRHLNTMLYYSDKYKLRYGNTLFLKPD